MASSVHFVTGSKRQSHMPEWTPEFAELVEHVSATGVLAEAGRRLRFAYKRGFPALDLVVFFLTLACGSSTGGIRGFRTKINACAVRLAAIAGRARLPTSASVSRALHAADRIADLDQQIAWLLSTGAQVQMLVRSALVQTRDAFGAAWTVLDFDPSVIALRQRALPEGEDLPEPQRRAAPMCAPGYSGRHRGETQVSTAILSHTGAGLFVQATTHPGNTPFAQALGIAAKAAASLVDSCQIARGQTLIRFDGAGGYAAAIAEVLAQKLHYLTRLRNHAVFSEPGVAEHLASATWCDVIDSGSGPRRQATELGQYVLSHDDDGPATLQTRVVVSRFACPDGVKHGAGMVKDGFHYEAFVTSLPPSAFPSADTVTLYYGRAGQENQFGRAVRQIRLGEIFCFDLCGQRLATALMMWASNLRMTRAVSLVGELGAAPAQTPRPEAPELASPPALAPPPPAAQTLDVEPAVAVAKAPAISKHASQELATHALCPSGIAAPLHNIRSSNGSGAYAIYRMPAGACWPCPQRAQCSDSPNPGWRREFSMPLGSAALADRAQILARARACVAGEPKGFVELPIGPAALKLQLKPQTPLCRWAPPCSFSAGPMLYAAPVLRPSVLLQIWHDHNSPMAIDVRITPAQPRRKQQPWIAVGDQQRQARRQTWRQRHLYNALHDRVTVARRPRVDDSPGRAMSRMAA